jgi:FlaA1/EpsC-like NDP-sugar epimerase
MSSQARVEHRIAGRLVVVDLVAAVLAVVLAVLVRYGSPAAVPTAGRWLAAVLPAAWVIVLAINHGYAVSVTEAGSDAARRVTRSFLTLTAAVTLILLLADVGVARGFVFVVLPTIWIFGLVLRSIGRNRALLDGIGKVGER